MVRKTAIAIDTIINQKKFNEGTDESKCWFSEVKDFAVLSLTCYFFMVLPKLQSLSLLRAGCKQCILLYSCFSNKAWIKIPNLQGVTSKLSHCWVCWRAWRALVIDLCCLSVSIIIIITINYWKWWQVLKEALFILLLLFLLFLLSLLSLTEDFFGMKLKLCTVILIAKFHDMSTVTFPWQHKGLQAISIQKVK